MAELYYYRLKDRSGIHLRNRASAFKGTATAVTGHPDYFMVSDTKFDMRRRDTSIRDVTNTFDIPVGLLERISKPDYETIYWSNFELNLFDHYPTIPEDLGEPTSAPVVQPEPESTPERTLSAPITIRRNFFSSHLTPQITSRYLLDRTHSGYANFVTDSILPSVMVDYNFKLRNMQSSVRRGCAISPFTATMLDLPLIPVMDLCNILGYSSNRLKKLIAAVSRKRISMVFAGLGGTGNNTIYWLHSIQEYLQMDSMFEHVYLHEEDTLEFSNLLRFPISNATIYGDIDKVTTVSKYASELSSNGAQLTPSYLPKIKSNGTVQWISSALYGSGEFKRQSTVIYGAPDLVSRSHLSKLGNFICATHADLSCSMWLNPSQDLDIQVESYGMIQLAPFFMNQLKMAITLLEVLASNQNLKEQDKSLLEFSFDGEVTPAEDLPEVKKYSFYIKHNVTAAGGTL